MAGQKIGDWDAGKLQKVVQESISQNPTQRFQAVIAEELEVVQKIIVAGTIVVPGAAWKLIGSTGAPAFQNSWVNYDAGYRQAAYRKDAFGTVYLRGMVKNGTVGSAAFTLPPGFRPSLSELFASMSPANAGRVDVTNAGAVIPTSPTTNGWVTLSGISFSTD